MPFHQGKPTAAEHLGEDDSKTNSRVQIRSYTEVCQREREESEIPSRIGNGAFDVEFNSAFKGMFFIR